MTNRFLAYCAILIALLLTSCDNNEAPDVTQINEKTVFLFMPWSSTGERPYSKDLYSYFVENIGNIEKAITQQGGMPNYRLVTFISLSPQYAALVETTYDKGKCQRDTLKRYHSYDYTTPAGIAGLLGDVRHYAEAGTYAMVIGCHGKGWIPKDVNSFYSTRAFGGVDSRMQIEIPDLAQGIAQAAMPMQYIAFDDCYMAGIEVAYDLRHAAQYLIASTSEIMAEGLSYQKIWPYMAATKPDYWHIVDGFHDYYIRQTYPYGTLSVIDCSQAEAMASFMRDVNSRYTFDSSQTGQLQKLDGMGQTIFYDMQSYIHHLCSFDDIVRFDQLIGQLVPYHSHTDQIYTDLSNVNGGFSTVTVNTFCGITISDPTTNYAVASRKQQTSWWAATHP